MTEDLNRYVFLDDENDRKRFLERVHAIRQDVIELIQRIPQEKWYESRYHGWSLGAMVAHLNLVDNFSLLSIKLALVGVRPAVSMPMIDQINGLTASLFRNRLVQTSVKSVYANEQRIADFLLQLPISKFSTQIYDPPLGKLITIEQYIQERFLFHWQRHLSTMQQVEGFQPRERPDNAS